MKRIICWFKGHDINRRYKAELGYDELSCNRCGKQNDELHYQSYKSLYERHEDLFGFLLFIGAFILSGLLLCIIASLIIWPFASYTCQKSGLAMELASKYDYWAGCFYQIDGQWVADDLLGIVELIK